MEMRSRGEITVDRERLNEVTMALDVLTAVLEDDGELDSALKLVCRQVIQVVPGADMASVTLVRDGTAETAACTDQRVFDIDADRAFQLLVEQSQRENVKLHVVAERLVARIIQVRS